MHFKTLKAVFFGQDAVRSWSHLFPWRMVKNTKSLQCWSGHIVGSGRNGSGFHQKKPALLRNIQIRLPHHSFTYAGHSCLLYLQKIPQRRTAAMKSQTGVFYLWMMMILDAESWKETWLTQRENVSMWGHGYSRWLKVSLRLWMWSSGADSKRILMDQRVVLQGLHPEHHDEAQ